jgi:hypothetical protein
MKTFLVLFLFCLSQTLNAQNSSGTNDEISSGGIFASILNNNNIQRIGI